MGAAQPFASGGRVAGFAMAGRGADDDTAPSAAGAVAVADGPLDALAVPTASADNPRALAASKALTTYRLERNPISR